MITRAVAIACLALALAVPINAAQAGILKNVAKVAVVGAKFNGAILKEGLKGGAKAAKSALKGGAKLGKLGAVGNAQIAKCAVKALTKKPCI